MPKRVTNPENAEIQMDLEITWEQKGGIAIAILAGRIDRSNAEQTRKVLESGLDPRKALVLDFGKVSFMSSAGMRVLRVATRANHSGKQVALCTPPDSIREVLAIYGFDRTIPTYPSRDAAIQALQNGRGISGYLKRACASIQVGESKKDEPRSRANHLLAKLGGLFNLRRA